MGRAIHRVLLRPVGGVGRWVVGRGGWMRRTLRVVVFLLGLCILATLGLVLWAWLALRGSLPQLDGERTVEGLSAEVRVERDGLGIPTIRGQDRRDVAFATGFVHAQDRFFQMDLLRRHAAGELAALLGGGLVEEDRKNRVHRFRARAERVIAGLSPSDRTLLDAYVNGVEAGRRALSKPPWEYLVLRVDPAPWTAADTVLAVYGMYLALQEAGPAFESARAVMHDTLPALLVAFLSPPGSQWDAALDGTTYPPPPLPGPEVIDLRRRPVPSRSKARALVPHFDESRPGSNNWAVAGKHTAHGGAIVANDMHLRITVPGIWYRVRLIWPAGGGGEHTLSGITLPGTPALVVGSNTHIAWGFTNTEGDWTDLVVLKPDPHDAGRYRTPDGFRPYEKHVETIEVHGAPDETLVVEETIWGPVVDRDHRGRKRALRWVAHDPEGLNFHLMNLESARTVAEALAVAPTCGQPAQNFVVGDAEGSIGWTVLGRIPRRVGFDGRLPVSWADGRCRWDGWLDAKDYPRIVNPPDGLLWTANNRVVGGAMLQHMGRGHFDLGARAGQIRDRLRAGKTFRETDMLAIQLDDRALFLERWRTLLLDTLSPAALKAKPERRSLRQAVEQWGGRAAVDSTGFRIVRRFRHRVYRAVLEPLTAPCSKADRSFFHGLLDANVEDSVWRLVTEHPPHLLPLPHASWGDLLLSEIDALAREIGTGHESVMAGLGAYKWGTFNVSRVHHPFSQNLPLLPRWLDLDLPDHAMAGDSAHMPRVHAPAEGGPFNHGASERMAVSPGREAQGYFHMPAGQSGHPLSPHYRDGHAAWVEGRPTPFLPGEAIHVLVLKPAG